jgi:hypothetical protein
MSGQDAGVFPRGGAAAAYQPLPVADDIPGKQKLDANSPQAQQDLRVLLKTLAACLLWLICSSTIILVNKYIMVRRSAGRGV